MPSEPHISRMIRALGVMDLELIQSYLEARIDTANHVLETEDNDRRRQVASTILDVLWREKRIIQAAIREREDSHRGCA